MKINRLLSSVMALLLVVGLACSAQAEVNWNTTTTGLDVRTDISAVSATTSRTLNMSLLGVDSLGNVDVFGESGGSTLMASVTTLLGVSGAGGVTPAGSSAGFIASTTRYVDLNQGVGVFTLSYPASASGTDIITVNLFEKRSDDGGNTVTRQIASKTVSIAVAVAVPSSAILNIESFTTAGSDTNGASNATPVAPANENADLALAQGAARMTADAAGGIFQVKSYTISGTRAYFFDATATGTVTLTFTAAATKAEALGANYAAAGTTYTATGTMVDGVANVSLPTGFTVAGCYSVVATMGDLNSIAKRVTNTVSAVDYFDIAPLAIPSSVALSCNMAVVSETPAAVAGSVFDPTFTGKLLDKFGNKIVAVTSPGGILKVTDVNAKLSDFNITIPAAANSAALVVDGDGFTPGLASLTASVPANTLLAASSAVALKVVAAANQLVTSGLYAAPVAVGTSFKFSTIGVDADESGALVGAEANTLLSTSKVRISNLATTESLSVAVTDDNPDSVLALYTKPTTAALAMAGGFLVQDIDQSYADVIVYPTTLGLAFTVGSPSQAFLKDTAGNIVTDIVATVNGDGSYTVAIDMGNLTMKDAYGNTNNQGNVSITTTKGTSSVAKTVGAAGQIITISYPAGTEGTDKPAVTFTQPGITSLNSGADITISFPSVSGLASFETMPATSTELSINAATPLTIFPRTAAGTLLTAIDGYFIDYNSAVLDVETAAGVTLVSGANVGINTARLPLLVSAKTTPGEYTITVRSIDSTITKAFTVKVVEYTIPLALSSSAVELATGATSALTITGGSAPYTAVSADGAVVTAAVAESTLTLTAVAEGGPVNVTVTDAKGATKVVAVTVGQGGPVAVGGTVAGMDKVAADVNATYALSLNTTPEAGDTPAQEWIIIGGTNGVSGMVWYFAYNGSAFVVNLDTTAAAYVGALTSPFLVHPGVNLANLGYTAAGGGDLYAAYAYSTEATGTFQSLLTSGKIVIKNITDLDIAE